MALGVPWLAAACGDEAESDSGATTPIDWSSSSGAGGATTTATGSTVTGTGGASSSTGGGGASTSSGSGGGGGVASYSIALLGGGTAPYGAAYDGSAWSGANITGASLDAPSLVLLSSGEAVGLVRGGSLDALQFTSFAAGSWSAWAAVGTSTTRAAPSLVSAGASVHAVLHDTSFMHAYAAYDGAAWSPTNEGLTPGGGSQSFGPSAPRVALVGGEPVTVFAGNDETLYAQTRSGGAWQAAVPVAGSNIFDPPAITALSSGAELLVVYINHQPAPPPNAEDKKLYYATRTSGVWSAPQKISDQVFAVEPPTITALAGGEALIAFRGTDNKGYTVRYTPGATPWGAPTPIGNPNPDIASPPGVASGSGTFVAELAYVDAASGAAHHVRHDATGWGTATLVGGSGLTHVAIASAP
jgi:hypothetical protein